MSIKVLAPERLVKQPGESRSYAMDFANLLATGETLSAVVGSAAVSPVTVPRVVLFHPFSDSSFDLFHPSV